MAPGIPSQAHSSAASEIRIANNMDEIARVAELVDSFGADNRLSNEVVIALNVSLDEILNNIISYAYADADRHDDPERSMSSSRTTASRLIHSSPRRRI
jgi:sigma-B regulation protein RsbU (phosphoserine phosphatase)